MTASRVAWWSKLGSMARAAGVRWYGVIVRDAGSDRPLVVRVLGDGYARPERVTLLEIQRPGPALRIEATPHRLVASRVFDPRWPDDMQRMYRVCLAAYEAWRLDFDLQWDTTDRRDIPAQRETWLAWYACESSYAPRFVAWYGEQRAHE